MMVSMPSQGDISQLLALLELVKLAADADKSRELVLQIAAARKEYDDAVATAAEQQRLAAKAVREASERIAAGDAAERLLAEARAEAERLVAEAKTARDEAAAGVESVRERSRQVADAERAAAAATASAAKVLEQAKATAEAIVADAKAINDRAAETLEQASKKRAEYEEKLERIRVLAND